MCRLIYILLVALPVCFACSSAISETSINTESTIKAQLNSEEVVSKILIKGRQAIKYQNLKLQVINVEDSRCAIGTVCIWAGQVVVTIEISNKQGDKREVKLVHKREPEVVTTLGYRLFLLDVEPHPKQGKVIQLSDQIITLNIVKTM